jgi:transcriptional regulator with XRE-family HTH domain
MTVIAEIDLAALRWMRAATLDGNAKRIRLEALVSVTELAERVGVSAVSVTRWENGQRMPRGQTARRYAATLLELQGPVLEVRSRP